MLTHSMTFEKSMVVIFPCCSNAAVSLRSTRSLISVDAASLVGCRDRAQRAAARFAPSSVRPKLLVRRKAATGIFSRCSLASCSAPR